MEEANFKPSLEVNSSNELSSYDNTKLPDIQINTKKKSKLSYFIAALILCSSLGINFFMIILFNLRRDGLFVILSTT